MASPALTLHYWNGRGLAEPARLMLTIAGKSFTDERHSSPPAEGLDANLGRLPVLDVVAGGSKTTIGQSKAIWQFIAQTEGFLGENALEAAQITALAEHVSEMMAVYSKHVPWGSAPSEETFAALFDDETASDVAGPAVSATSAKRNLRYFAQRLERLVGGDGFAVGAKLSLADVLIYYRFGDALSAADNDKVAPHMREPLGSQARTDKLLAACPKLAKIVANVRGNAHVAKFLAARTGSF